MLRSMPFPMALPTIGAERKRKGLTQEEAAREIGTGAPQVSRTEHKPEHSNVRTLMRYATAVGMTLDMKLVAK